MVLFHQFNTNANQACKHGEVKRSNPVVYYSEGGQDHFGKAN